MNSDLLEMLLGRPRWQRDAACVEFPDVTFFTDRGEPTDPAKAVCASCLVRAECLAYALDNSIMFGVWGGTSENERRALRRVGRPTTASRPGRTQAAR